MAYPSLARGMTEAWRLILPDPLDGPANMAIDDALLTLVGEGVSPPTLRFYEWRSPWISLGTAQLASDLDLAGLATRDWGILRRASGGTAVLHNGQLGYALILPTDHPFWAGDLAASYRRIAEPLALGFARLGVCANAAPPSFKAAFSEGAPRVAARVCFSALGPYELLDQRGRKLIGNSQVRRRAGALQHGTIQVSGSQSAIADVLANLSATERSEIVRYLSTHVGSVEESAGRPVCASEIIDALARSIEEAFAVHLAASSLTDRERCLADELVKTKYGERSWTFRR